MRERERFIEAYLTGFYTSTELADRFGMSRQKLHKWLARHNADGMKRLSDRSRAPLHIPHRTSDEVAEQIIAFRRRFPHMQKRPATIYRPTPRPNPESLPPIEYADHLETRKVGRTD